MPINIFISDTPTKAGKEEKTIPPTNRITQPGNDDEVSYSTTLEFVFIAPGNDPADYALQVISYRPEGGTLVYSFRGERTGAHLTPSDDPVLTSPYNHYEFTGATTYSIGSDSYVLLILAKVEPGGKRKVLAVRQLTS